MDLKEKQLLLADLCARLPYGVKVWYRYKTWDSEKFATSIRLADEKIALSSKFEKEGDWFPIEEAGEILIKPYLRPMSSMTEEERNELYHYDNAIQRTDFFYSHHIDCRFMIEKGLALEAPEGMYK